MAVTFAAWGGADTIGASCYTIEFGDVLCMVDCGGGYYQSGRVKKPSYDGPPPKYLFLTHAHLDHIGVVILAMKRWPDMVVFATPETKALAESVWKEMLFVAQQLHLPEPFSESDIARAAHSIQSIIPGQKHWLADDLNAQAVWAGHVLGAVSFVFAYRNAAYVFTGDLSYRDGFFFEKATPFKVAPGPCALLVQDATYIGQVSEPWESERVRFVQRVQEVVSGGGQVLIPALATGRAQEIIATLLTGGIDPRALYLDGAGMRTEVFRKMCPPSFRHLLDAYQSFRNEDHRTALKTGHSPAAIVATSGMMNWGSPSSGWAEHVLRYPDSLVVFVNWLEPCSPAGQVWRQRDNETIEIVDENSQDASPRTILRIPRGAAIERFSCFSGHINDDDRLQLEKALNPERVVYVHGDGSAMDSFIATQGQDGVSRFRSRECVTLML